MPVAVNLLVDVGPSPRDARRVGRGIAAHHRLTHHAQGLGTEVGSRTMSLPDPFFVLATQNPIEQEGTYPLPEAQLDRFMFMVMVDYPKRDDELEMLKRTTGSAADAVRTVLDAGRIVELQELVRRVPVGEYVYNLALDLARATRPNEPGAILSGTG